MPNKTDYTFDVQTWPGGSWAVKAKAPDGQVIGDAVGDTLEDETGPSRLYEQREVWVDPEHRRRGVATGMIRALEKATKIRFRPTGEFTPEGRKWWNSMRRKNPSQPKKPRASEADMLDAIQHADLNGDQGWTLADFNILPMGETPLSRIRGYEDWGAWIDVAPEDFAGLSTEERLKELESFRGQKWAARAREWLEHGVPPVVVIDAPIVDENHLHRQIGDGRGRINFALAMGLKTLPVVIMKWKHALPPGESMRKNPMKQPGDEPAFRLAVLEHQRPGVGKGRIILAAYTDAGQLLAWVAAMHTQVGDAYATGSGVREFDGLTWRDTGKVWSVAKSNAWVDGWGPLLYEALLVFVEQHYPGAWVTADTGGTSSDARRVWRTFSKRADVEYLDNVGTNVNDQPIPALRAKPALVAAREQMLRNVDKRASYKKAVKAALRDHWDASGRFNVEGETMPRKNPTPAPGEVLRLHVDEAGDVKPGEGNGRSYIEVVLLSAEKANDALYEFDLLPVDEDGDYELFFGEREEPVYYINNLEVDATRRGVGLGRKLVEAAISDVDQPIWLVSAAPGVGASPEGFYKKLGFEAILRNDLDQVLMRKTAGMSKKHREKPRKNPQTQPLPVLTREPGPAQPNMAGEVKQTSKNPARFAVWDGEGWPWSVQWPSVYPGTPDDPDADYGAEDALKRVDAAEREHARRKLGLGLSARKALRKKNPRSSDYQGTHLPPGPEDGAPAHDVENMMPDYYAHPEWYFAGGRGPADHEAARILRSVRGRPWAPVWVYRAVPKGVDVLAINPGDWVTTVRAYATEHAEASLGGRGKSHILKAKVRAGELFNEGNSHFEFGWWPASDEQAKTWQAARRETPGYKASAAKVRQNPSETHGPSCAGGMHKAPGGWVEIGDCPPAPRMRRNPKGPALVGKLVTPEACFNLAAEAFRKVGIAVEEYHKTATSHVVGMDKGNVWYEPSRRGALWMGHVAPASLKLKFTPGGSRHAGLCRWHNVFRTLEIQLNKAAWGGFDDDYRADTILHEVAHAIQFVLQGKSDHGPEWKRIALSIGCSGEACVTGDKAVAMRKAVAKAKGLPEPLGLRLADIEVGDEVAFVNKKKVVRGTVTRKVPPDAKERAALRGGYVLFRVPVGPDFPQGATGKLSAELVVEHKRPGA